MDFLWQVIEDLSTLSRGIPRATVAMAAFNMVKFHIILLKKFIEQFSSSSSFQRKHSQKE